jgi:predicted RNA methylase
MIVLDVGAGEGETARFFLEHGAKSVICIEKNINCAKWLRKNAECHPISYFIKPFELNDLNMNFDFLKMDIEGYEEMLLDKHVVIQKPCVVEVHGLQLWDRFQELGYVVKNKHIDYGAECFVYRCLDKAKVIK